MCTSELVILARKDLAGRNKGRPMTRKSSEPRTQTILASISYEQRRKHLQSSEIYEELEFDTQTMRRAPRCIVRESMIVSTPYKESSRLVNTQPSTISRRSSRLYFSPSRLRVYSMHDGYGR